MQKILLLWSCLLLCCTTWAQTPCASFAGGPYSDQEIDVAGCDGTALSAPYAAWLNEVYYTSITAGGSYNFNICDGYSSTAWGGEAVITAILNGTVGDGIIEGGTVLATATGCSIDFDAPEDGTVFFILSTEDACAAALDQVDNGIPTIVTLSGVSCSECGDGACGIGESYGNCTSDCPCSSEGVFVDFDAEGNPIIVEAAALYCESAFTGVNAPYAYVPIAVFGDALTGYYQLSNEDGIPFANFDANGVFSASETEVANLVFLQVDQAAFDAAGGSTTVTFTSDEGACIAELTIDWTAFGAIDIEGICGGIEPPTCEASYGSVLFDGATTLCANDELAPICLEDDNLSEDYASLLVITTGAELNIVGLAETCTPFAAADLPAGDYTFHAFNLLLADTTTLVNALIGGATGADVAALIADGSICADLDVTGIAVTILPADAAECQPEPTCEASYGSVTFNGANTTCSSTTSIVSLCLEGDNTDGYASVWVLTAGSELTIVDLGEPCTDQDLNGLPAGNYTLHAFNFALADTTTIGNAVLNGATGADVAALIADGTICAALDVTGIALTILPADAAECQPVNVAPTAANGSTSVGVNSPDYVVQLSEYVSDADTDLADLTYSVTQPANGGSVSVDEATGAATVSVDADFLGSFTFTYTVSDGTNSATANITVFIQAPLNVALIRLTGVALTNGNLISWATAIETNNDYYTLYHSTDGSNFTKIAVIDGAGNTTAATQYSYTDAYIAQGISYYRLTQTDFDGTTQSLGELAVRRTDATGTIAIQPNPANHWANISFDTDAANTAQLLVHDVTGKVVHAALLQITAGNNTTQIDMTDWAAGMYFVSIRTSSSTLSAKLLKN